ncbi:MAG: RecX family transcriptional regulator [Prevotellaceae bacterium]|jgi:regulatory protein|nr:RecX family transcriptional regulator [Prevotellaceae bacterium]
MNEKEAYNRAAAYCSTAEHCRSEVMEKLQRWEVAPAEAERIVRRLTEERFIDEARYSRAFVRDKYRFAKWGKTKIMTALRTKQIDTDTARAALDSIDEEEYLDILRNLLAAKRRTVSGANDYQRTGKLIRFALGRGYEMQDIRRYLSVEGIDD